MAPARDWRVRSTFRWEPVGSDCVDTTDLVATLARARTVDEVAAVSLRFLMSLPGVVRAGIALAVVGGRQLRFLSSDAASLEPPLPWCSIDAYDHLPLNDTVRTGRDVVLDPVGFARRYPDLFGNQGDAAPRSVVALALRSGERRLGGLLVYRELAEPAPDLELVADFTARVVGALLAVARSAPDGPVELGCDQASAEERPREVVHRRLPADETGPGAARRFLRDCLEGWGVDETVTEAALLCASEVVTNVVLHVQESSVISVHRHDEWLTVHVHQASGPERPRIAAVDLTDPLSIAGRGLALVEAMSARWGTTSTASVHCVWYEVSLVRPE